MHTGFRFVLASSLALIAVAAVTLLAVAASVTPIYVQGDTISPFMFRHDGNIVGQPVATPTPKPLFENRDLTAGSAPFQYLDAAIGGASVSAFEQHVPSVQRPVPGEPPYVSNLFPRYPYPALDFLLTASPLSSVARAQYAKIAPLYGPLVEAPIAGYGLAVEYNPTLLKIPARSLQLSRNTYCGIFTGKIVSFADPHITRDNGGVVGNLPLVVVRRADADGATFALSEHLATVCRGPGIEFPWTAGVGTTISWPPKFEAALGDAGVAQKVAARAGAIGYGGLAYVYPFANTIVHPANLQNAAAFNAGALTFTAPAPAAVESGLREGPFAQPPPGYPRIPFAYIPNPGANSAYPIVGLSYGEFYTCVARIDPHTGRGGTTILTGIDTLFAAIVAPAARNSLDNIAIQSGMVPLQDSLKAYSKERISTLRVGPVAGVCAI